MGRAAGKLPAAKGQALQAAVISEPAAEGQVETWGQSAVLSKTDAADGVVQAAVLGDTAEALKPDCLHCPQKRQQH